MAQLNHQESFASIDTASIIPGSYAPSFAEAVYTTVDLHALATNPEYLSTLTAAEGPSIHLLSYHPDFVNVLGPDAHGHLVADLEWEAFHEAGIYNAHDNSLYVTSNYQSLTDNINITVMSLDDYSVRSTQFPDVWEANGGTTYYPPGSDTTETPPRQVYCDEGDFEHHSQLVSVDPLTNTSEILLNNFMGKNFSSINDVRQHPVTGDLWFTDAAYGYIQNFRPKPMMPMQVYRFEPTTGAIQVVADGFSQSNGLEFSPDLKTLYVSDTGSSHGELENPATIYAFDVIDQKRLGNRWTFSYSDVGFPDGVHCDMEGNVWVGAGDGVHVYNDKGVLLGKVHVGETSNNFAFAPGRVFVFANHRLWVVEDVAAKGREVCREYGVGCE